MNAFHGDPKIKQKYIDRVIAHQKADEIIKGVYWQNGKGCAVGCTIHSGNHRAYEYELGIPEALAKLEDGIFEGLPNDLAKTWPLRFLESINVGADLSNVWPKFAIWLLTDKTYGVIQFAKPKRIKKFINNVSNLYLRSLKEKITKDEWSKVVATAACDYDATDAAAYAAASAAYATATHAAYATATHAAYDASAAYDAKRAAAYAAYAAAYAASATYEDAKINSRIRQSEKLLELLSECE